MTPAPYGLIASMDPARGESYRRIVASAGLEPLVTRDGDEARATLVARGAPGLMLTELSLPRFDGFRLLETLRRVASPEETPAIVVTGFSDLRDAAERRRDELGIAAILTPHMSSRVVQRAVKRALERGDAPLATADLEDETPSTARSRPGQTRAIGHAGLAPLLRPVLDGALRALSVPVGFVSLLDAGRPRVWVGVGVDERSPEALLLSEQVVMGNDVLVIPDASDHPLFARDLQPSMQGYAAAPIVSSRGEVLGAIGIIDDGILSLGPAELEELTVYARQAAGEVELAAEPLAPGGFEGALQLAEVLSHLDSGVALLDAEQRIVFGNPALAAMSDLDPGQLAGMSRQTFVAALAELAVDVEDAHRRLRVGAGRYACRDEIELGRPRRRVLRWVARPLCVDGEIAQLEIFDDVTAEIDLAREREHLARTDWLTGLINRRGGEEAIAREVARARRLGSSLCFAMFDIDRFKQVNDAHGHPVGDEVLREVAQVMHGAVRGSDLAVRWGGDEILVVLPAVPESGARVFAERVRRRVAALDLPVSPRVTVSGGVAELGKIEDAAAAIARADARMYQAKAEGRNRVK